MKERRRDAIGNIFRYQAGQPVPIVVSGLQDYAGVLGAGAVAWEPTCTLCPRLLLVSRSRPESLWWFTSF